MIQSSEIVHVANLARLKLSPEEIIGYTQEIEKILDYANILDQVDTSQIEATTQVLSGEHVLRPDRVEEFMHIETTLANAPQTEGRYYTTPKILSSD